jgi:drug/metabolite transporter (DMT)-like permease
MTAMPASAQFASALFALGSVGCWGVSDFLGGHTAKRFNSFFLSALGHLGGTIMVASLALSHHEVLPPFSHLRWAMAAGAAGGVGLAFFYQALAEGNMGIAAPVSAVLGAAIPTAFGIFTEGFPGAFPLVGFVLAVVGIWLISRTEDGSRPKGLGLALISGLGFALFFIFIKQAGSGAALWIAAGSRGSSLIVTALITLLGWKFRPTYPLGYVLGLLAGCLDVSGTALFIRASQIGRLDTAVVLTSLYPVITVLLARIILKEHFTVWKTVGMAAALAAVPLIAHG